MNVLRVLLSPAGYQKVIDIMGADRVLSDSGTPYAAGSYYTLCQATNPSPIYFRITGPTVHIEFAHQGGPGRGGPSHEQSGVQAGGINHIHTVYRDPTNEYGTAWTLSTRAGAGQ